MHGSDRKTAKNYKDLIAWQRAMDLTLYVYDVTKCWPKTEMYGLTNQIRRAAVSIPSNIAEGQGRASTREFMHHLGMARGSMLEVETQAMLAQRLGYLPAEAADELLDDTSELGRVLNGLLRSLDGSD